MQTVRLKPKHDPRVRGGHPWVFSNEIADDVGGLESGGAVEVFDAKGTFLGVGIANPNSLIAIRILSRKRGVDLDSPDWWTARIRAAAAYRAAVYPDRASLRMVNAEGDGLSGLIVDRYGDHLAVQLNAVGTERRRGLLEVALREALSPASAVLRSEGKARQLEGLPDERAVWFGEPPESVVIDELGVRMRIALLGGQKTGHFFDQAENRAFAGKLCRGRTVLDVYAHTGSWALHALAGGAARATVIDRSEEACGRAVENAALNGVSDRLEAVCGDAHDTLRALSGEAYGAVILDPPAFAKSRKTAGNAIRGYREINELAIRLVAPGGLFFTSSCSYHAEEERFVEAVAEAARAARRSIRIIRRGEQAPDHPMVPWIPETRYLKSLALYVD
jgi:23S rRNA (cytosine1962-C5)-methyltransferase